MFWRTKKRSTLPQGVTPSSVGGASLGSNAEAGKPQVATAAGGARGAESASAGRWTAAADYVAASSFGGAGPLLQHSAGLSSGVPQASSTPVSARAFSLGGSDSESSSQAASSTAVAPGGLVHGIVPNAVGAAFVVPRGYRVTGSICMVEKSIRIDGELAGRALAAQRVVVSSGATLRAPTEADEIVVEGTITAPLRAQGHLEVRAGGEIRDVEVEAAHLTVLPGASLKGCALVVGSQDEHRVEPHSVAAVTGEAA
jgi:cytoskeletal protein CcmA (bactofilin family)